MKDGIKTFICSFIYSLRALSQGLLMVLKHAFRPRVTLCYPEKKQELPERFRGSVAFDREKCIGCRLCQKFCPSINCITIDEKIESVNLGVCANCGNCAYYCPKDAIYITKRYELATEDKKDLLLSSENQKEANL